MTTKLINAIKNTVDNILSQDSIRIISHYDADGITAGAILAKALARKYINFHLSLTKSLNIETVRKIKNEDNSIILFFDMGSGQISMLENENFSNTNIIIYDHHAPIKQSKITQINPYFFGYDGMYECCSATISYLLAINIDLSNTDLISLAFAGIVGDKQLPLKGINKEIVADGMKNNEIVEEKGFGIPQSEYPAKDESDSLKLIKLLKTGVRYETLEQSFNKYILKQYNMYAHEFVDILNACGRLNVEGLGIEVCLDKNKIKDAIKIKEEYINMINKYLSNLKDIVIIKDHIQYFYITEPGLGGVIAGIGINYLLAQDKPIFALSKSNNIIKVSARGTKYLVSKGLNLATALKQCAESVNGHGGGHAIAAGASIPENRENIFLEMLDKIICEQIT